MLPLKVVYLRFSVHPEIISIPDKHAFDSKTSQAGLNISTPLQTPILICVFNIILQYNAWGPEIFLPVSFFHVSKRCSAVPLGKAAAKESETC